VEELSRQLDERDRELEALTSREASSGGSRAAHARAAADADAEAASLRRELGAANATTARLETEVMGPPGRRLYA
jgi:cell division septum initiation protein DivIVA